MTHRHGRALLYARGDGTVLMCSTVVARRQTLSDGPLQSLNGVPSQEQTRII
jgi:hypothetical protein